VSLAEDFAQDALLAALEQWTGVGRPRQPGRLADHGGPSEGDRRRSTPGARVAEAEEMAGELRISVRRLRPTSDLGEPIGDEVLRLIFICCHPVLSREARVALTLRLVSGLTTEEVARAFLVPVPTLAQRIVRAKRTLREARVPFELPPERELPERLASVLEVIYLVFNEGYVATVRAGSGSGPSSAATRSGWGGCSPVSRRTSRRCTAWWRSWNSRPRGSRRGGWTVRPSCSWIRTGPLGPDPHRRGLESLERAQRLGGALGPYALQAAIAACHARAATPDETDWEHIAALYDALAQLMPSPSSS
jgi:predicted RNA polymerase sigma factor